MVPEPLPSEDVMPLPSDLDPEADQAVQALLRSQTGLTIPPAVRSHVLSALADEAATRAALLGNDADPIAPDTPLRKSLPPSNPVLPAPHESPSIERHP